MDGPRFAGRNGLADGRSEPGAPIGDTPIGDTPIGDTAIPEPSTYLMLGAFLAILAARRRARRA